MTCAISGPRQFKALGQSSTLSFPTRATDDFLDNGASISLSPRVSMWRQVHPPQKPTVDLEWVGNKPVCVEPLRLFVSVCYDRISLAILTEKLV